MRERISNKMMEKENFNVVDIFGENVFNDSVMQARLPKKVYKKLHEVMEEGKELDLNMAVAQFCQTAWNNDLRTIDSPHDGIIRQYSKG